MVCNRILEKKRQENRKSHLNIDTSNFIHILIIPFHYTGFYKTYLKCTCHALLLELNSLSSAYFNITCCFHGEDLCFSYVLSAFCKFIMITLSSTVNLRRRINSSTVHSPDLTLTLLVFGADVNGCLSSSRSSCLCFLYSACVLRLLSAIHSWSARCSSGPRLLAFSPASLAICCNLSTLIFTLSKPKACDCRLKHTFYSCY